MEHQTARKTYQYKHRPTSEQERELERTLMLCRHLYNAAIGERREAWRMRSASVTSYQQKAELPGIKEAMPEYAEVNAQVLQDIVLRVDRAFEAFFQRIQEGRSPGYRRFHGRERYNSCSWAEPACRDENGARTIGLHIARKALSCPIFRRARHAPKGAPPRHENARDVGYAVSARPSSEGGVQPAP
jgi:putative transposase